MTTLMKQSGIYMIKNLINDKIYIGSATNFSKRKCEHFRRLRKNMHENSYLQNAWNKYEEKNFTFIVLEITKKEDLLLVEQKYIDQYFDKQINCYNIAKNASSPMKGRKHTEEYKKRVSQSMKGQPIHPNTLARLLDKEKNPFAKSGKDHPKTGKKASKETRKLISIKVKNHKRTPEHCQNISKSLMGKPLKKETIKKLRDGRRKGTKNAHSKKVAQYDLDGNLIKIWNYMSEACQKLGVNLASMSSCCNGKYKTAGGYIWKFV